MKVYLDRNDLIERFKDVDPNEIDESMFPREIDFDYPELIVFTDKGEKHILKQKNTFIDPNAMNIVLIGIDDSKLKEMALIIRNRAIKANLLLVDENTKMNDIEKILIGNQIGKGLMSQVMAERAEQTMVIHALPDLRSSKIEVITDKHKSNKGYHKHGGHDKHRCKIHK